MPYKKLHQEIKNRVNYLLPYAGSRFNKLSVTTIRETNRPMAQLEVDPETAVVVISGYPGDSFAVGADIGQMLHFTSQDAFHFSEFGHPLFSQIKASRKPLIAPLNSITTGGGCDPALACDIHIAAETIQIAHPGAKLRYDNRLPRNTKLPQLVGKNSAREIFMSSESYNAMKAAFAGNSQTLTLKSLPLNCHNNKNYSL